MKKCICGHVASEHHTSIGLHGPVYGECLHYGFNETCGMRMTLTGWFFYYVLPPDMKTLKRRELRDRARRWPGLRRDWFKTHCMGFTRR